MTYGASPDDWLNLDLLGYGADLLPVVSNPNAPVSPNSSLKMIGKVPSRYNKDRQIVGIAKWTEKRATAKEIALWSKEPDYGICIQTRSIRAFDVDVSDPILSGILLCFFKAHFKNIVIRRRENSSKFLIAFVLNGVFSKRIMKVNGGIIEFLANGQQFIAVGTHPSGSRYEGLENIDQFPGVTEDQFDYIWEKLSEFAIEPPSSSSLRNPPGDDYAAPDEVSQYLTDEGHVLGIGKEGQHFLRCPFSHEHSEPDAPDGTATAYFPPSRGYEQGHWSCLHAHCHNRPEEEFLDAVGYRIKDFDILPDETENIKNDKLIKPSRFAPIQADIFAARQPPGWIIDGILPRAQFGLMFGASGSYKSFAAIDMGMAIATGRIWNSREVNSGKVIYICAEGSGSFKLRLRAYAQQQHIDLKTADFHIIEVAPSFLVKEDVKELLLVLKPYGPCAAIFVDTWAQTTPGGDENSGKDMSNALGNIRKLSEATQAIVIAVHHAGKDLTRGARGWSGLKAAADVEFELAYIAPMMSSFTVTKQKDGETGLTWTLRMLKIDLDPMAIKPLTSLIVTYEERKVTYQPLRAKKRGFWQLLFLNALDELGTPNMQDAVFTHMIKHAPTPEILPNGKMKDDRRREMCLQALKTLIREGEIELEKGVITRN